MDPAPQLAEHRRPPGRPLMHMRWENLLFLHWRWEAADLQRRLPPGLTIETFDDDAWLALVPFFMRGVRPAGLPALPWLSHFLELNVRTYVRDNHGRPGVWFFSLACNQPLAVEVARAVFGLNYVHARMAAHRSGSSLRYLCGRRDAVETAEYHYTPFAEAGEEARPGSLEFFLLERYSLYSHRPSGQLLRGRVHHPAYRYRLVETEGSFAPAVADGLPDPNRPPDHAMVTAPVSVEAWPVRSVE